MHEDVCLGQRMLQCHLDIVHLLVYGVDMQEAELVWMLTRVRQPITLANRIIMRCTLYGWS